MQYGQSLIVGLGPFNDKIGNGTNTAPLTGNGILNLANLGTTPVKVVGQPAAGANIGKARRCKIVCVTPGANIAYTTVSAGAAAPTSTAAGAGAATEGSLIIGGGGATEWITILDTQDLYLVASAASTVINVTVVEST